MSGKAKDGRAYTNGDAAAILGVDQATVKRWRSRGWIVNHPDGSLDAASSRARASSRRDPTHGGRPDRAFGGAGSPAPRVEEQPRPQARVEEPPRHQPRHSYMPADTGSDFTIGDGARLLKARAISATADAKLKQLRIQERTGELIPRAAVTQVYADTLADARSKLEALPTRLAHRLVGLDAVATRNLLQTEIEAVLKELADGLDADR